MARPPTSYFKVELDDLALEGQYIHPFRPRYSLPRNSQQNSIATRHSSTKEALEFESGQKSRMSHAASISNVHESEEILREPDILYMEETRELFEESFKRLKSLAGQEDNIMQHVLKMLPDKGRNTKFMMEGLIKEYKAKINEEKKVVARLIDLENSRAEYIGNLKEQAQKSEEEANKLRKYSEVRYDRQSGRFKKFEAESSDSEMYDWIVDINLLTDVSREGWRVQFSPKLLNPEIISDTENALNKDTMIKPDHQGWEGALVSVVGLYDKGKTFVLNNITNKNLPSGKKVNTKGLSFKSVNVDHGTKLVLLDTAGSYSPVKVVNELSVLEKEATEIFILDVVLELSDYFICVVNDFTSLDQRYLNRISRTLQNSATKTFKEIIVVHNLKEVDTEEVLNHIWETQVTQIYGSGSKQTTKVAAINPQTKNLQEKDVAWFKTSYSRHVCLCNDDSDLGSTINPWTFSLLKYWLKAVLVPVNRPFSVMDSVITQATAKLSSYFRCNVDLEVEETEDPLVKHIRSNRPLQDTHNHIPNISIDSTGFVMAKPDSFIPHVDIVQGDKYVIFLDIPGLSREEIVLARQNSITIVKGNRKKPAGLEENTLEKNERKYGEFTMTFRIPDIYKRKWEEVTVNDGVLCIKYAKDEDETTIV